MEYKVINSQLNANFEYKNEGIIISGSYSKNAENGKLISISGTCFRNNDGTQGDVFGTFYGYPQGDEILYDLSKMTRDDNNLVWDSISDIEPEVLPAEE